MRQQGWHHPTAMMGDPGLLQERPDITALLSQGHGDSEQSATADRTQAGLDAMADLALNHRLAQGTFCGVVGGLDSTDLQKGPKGIGHLEDLPAGADRFGPRRSLAAWMAQLHHPLQRGLKGLADRPAGLLQVGPIDGSFLVAVPVGKRTRSGGATAPIGHRFCRALDGRPIPVRISGRDCLR